MIYFYKRMKVVRECKLTHLCDWNRLQLFVSHVPIDYDENEKSQKDVFTDCGKQDSKFTLMKK